MTDEELRALVRDAIVRHLGEGAVQQVPPAGAAIAHAPPAHASHAMFRLTSGSESGGACIIEPAVACTHCGYCRSYGH
jgi:hypothetical protein